MGTVGFYDEDDYRLREILPLEFWPLYAVQLDTPEAEAAQKLKASDPLWVEVYRVYEKPQNVAALAIQRDKLVSALGAHLPRYERVETGSFGHAVPAERHEGFGFASGTSLFFDYNENNVVQHIWLSPYAATAEESAAFSSAISALAVFGSFLVFDGPKLKLMRADDRSALMRYFGHDE